MSLCTRKTESLPSTYLVGLATELCGAEEHVPHQFADKIYPDGCDPLVYCVDVWTCLHLRVNVRVNNAEAASRSFAINNLVLQGRLGLAVVTDHLIFGIKIQYFNKPLQFFTNNSVLTYTRL